MKKTLRFLSLLLILAMAMGLAGGGRAAAAGGSSLYRSAVDLALDETVYNGSGYHYSDYGGWGALYDIDGDGFDELLILTFDYESNWARVYDVENGQMKQRLDARIDRLLLVDATPTYFLGAANYQGSPVCALYVRGSKPGSSGGQIEQLTLYDASSHAQIASFSGKYCSDALGQLAFQVLLTPCSAADEGWTAWQINPSTLIQLRDSLPGSSGTGWPSITTTSPGPGGSASAPRSTPAPYAPGADGGSLSGLREGSTVSFGSYEQDNNFRNGSEAIEWIVLKVERNRALLLSRYCLDCIEYNDKNRGWKPWSGSLVREWLNGDFYKSAFSQSEKACIQSTCNVNRNNPQFGTRGGDDTWDNVFLLSLDEAEAYTSRDQRKAQPTAYARALGVQMNNENGCAWWWLRSPGEAESNAALVWSSGKIEVPGIYFAYAPCGVRPAVWVNVG